MKSLVTPYPVGLVEREADNEADGEERPEEM